MSNVAIGYASGRPRYDENSAGNTCQSTSQDTQEGGGVTDGGREEG